MDKHVKAVEWLWKNRDAPYIFGHSVLTEENRKNDPSTINPAMTGVEAANLFQFLERKELLFRQEGGHYIINKVEAYKWGELIADLKRWDWTRHWFWPFGGKVATFVIATIFGGIVGAVVTKWAESAL